MLLHRLALMHCRAHDCQAHNFPAHKIVVCTIVLPHTALLGAALPRTFIRLFGSMALWLQTQAHTGDRDRTPANT